MIEVKEFGAKQWAAWSFLFLGMRMVEGCADAEPRTEATSAATTTTHPTHGTTCRLQIREQGEIDDKKRIHTKIINFVLFLLYLLSERLQVNIS